MLNLYTQYRNELSKYREEPIKESVEETLEKYDRQYDKILIYDGNQLAGFLIIGRKEVSHPDCDYFICEAFVKPEHRKRGLTTDAITKYINSHPGTYCLDVLYGNNYARNFWFKVFKRNGYVNIELPFIEHGVTGIAETLFFTRSMYVK